MLILANSEGALCENGNLNWKKLNCEYSDVSKLVNRKTRPTARRVSNDSYGRRAFSVPGSVIWNWLPDSMRDTAISRDSFRRFYFQLTCVHSALELSGRCDLQIYLLTYLLTYSCQLDSTASYAKELYSLRCMLTDVQCTVLPDSVCITRSERYRLAVTAFAARWANVPYRQESP